MIRRALGLLSTGGGLLLGAALCAGALYTGVLYASVWRVPDRFNPWAPLVVADAPNLLTRYKLERLSSDAGMCRAVLAKTPIRFATVADRNSAKAGRQSSFARRLRFSDVTSASKGRKQSGR